MSLREISCLPLVVVFTACSLPRDSDGTLKRVRDGTMRVGVVLDTPWTTDSASGPGGIEAAMVRSLAHELNARVQWVSGREADLLPALKDRELDLVIGGLSATSPCQQEVAFTRPFYVDTIRVGGAPNAPPPGTLERVTVAIKPGDPVAAVVRKRGGIPAFVPLLDTARSPVAAPTWRLAQLARKGNPALELGQTQHVMAASPGENSFLVHVEQMLKERRSDLPLLLRRSGR